MSPRDSAISRKKVRTRVFAAGLVLALIAALVVLKSTVFVSVKETWFALSERNLRQVSSGVVLVRPTRFAASHFNGTVSTEVPLHGKPVPRIVGRNVSFRDLMATAYAHNAGMIALPKNAPKTNFDFLVTVHDNPQRRLQEVIQKQLGFSARVEPHEAQALALKVADPGLPALTVSGPDKHPGIEFKDGNLCFTHVPLGALTGNLERVLSLPIVNKTGLNDAYDFSVPWNVKLQQQLQNGPTARAAVDHVLNTLGLTLQPDIAQVEMLVVKGIY